MFTMRDIINVINVYLERRSKSQMNIFAKAMQRMQKFEEALESEDFNQAVIVQREIFDIIRSWPHVVKVISQKQVPLNPYIEEQSPRLLGYETRVERLWNKEPKEIIFEGPEKLDIDAFYYLRPHWNIRNADRYRIRHEQFHRTTLPEWIEIFTNNLFTSGRVKQDQFHNWILQFRDEEILICCKLFSALRIYDKDQIVDTWTKVYRQIPLPVLKGTINGDTVLMKLGHGAKSGSLNPYYFRQAISQEAEYGVLFHGNEKNLFHDISEYDVERLNLQKPKNIIFLDDFIGTGGQAKDFIKWYFPKYPWLLDTNIYLAVLSGYESAVNDVMTEIMRANPNLKFNVLVGDLLKDGDRAFSTENAIWVSESEREYAKQWAHNLGEELLQTVPGYSELDALGWKSCEALIAFDHNVPSNTLPIFWATGMRDGNKWIPLLKRYD